MDNQKLRTVLRVLEKYARPKILKYFRPDSCIASTKVAVDVLNHFGFPAFAQPVKVVVSNWKLRQRLESNTFDGVFKDGEWSVGLGYAGGTTISKTKPYSGHLVAILEQPKDDIIVDLSLDQSSRPHKDIHLEPSIWRLPKDWRSGKICIELPVDRCSLMYMEHNNLDYLTSLDWTDVDRTKPITDNLISIIDKRIK